MCVKTIVGTGFGDIRDFHFGSDQALYATDFANDRLIRVDVGLVGGEAPGRDSGVGAVAAFPNPFADRIEIRFAAPREPGNVRVRIVDATGRLVRRLTVRADGSGEGSLQWDGRSDDGVSAPAGVYVVDIEAHPGERGRQIDAGPQWPAPCPGALHGLAPDLSACCASRRNRGC